MTNTNADNELASCTLELDSLKAKLKSLKSTDSINRIVTCYAIMRISGALEKTFKTIVADFYESQAAFLNYFLENEIRLSSLNPSYQNMCNLAGIYDQQKSRKFRNAMNDHKGKKYQKSLESINNARNSLAHGGTTNISFKDLCSYYNDSKKIMERYDKIFS